jgi:hypothetical protein
MRVPQAPSLFRDKNSGGQYMRDQRQVAAIISISRKNPMKAWRAIFDGVKIGTLSRETFFEVITQLEGNAVNDALYAQSQFEAVRAINKTGRIGR